MHASVPSLLRSPRGLLRVVSTLVLALVCVAVTAPSADAAKKKKAKAPPAKVTAPAKPAEAPKAEPAKPAEPAKAEPAKPAAAKLDVTDLWMSKCKSCHGPDGKGKADKTADMTAAAWQKQFTDAQIRKAIAEGFEREKDGKTQKMKAFKDFTPDQLDGLVAHVRAFAK